MLKSASSKLLFLIAAFTKSPKDYIDVLSSPLPRISGYPKRDKTVKAAVNTLIDQNKIEYRKQGETIFIKPSRKGYEELSSSVPYYKSYLLRWDERFRLIFYDIPEDKRSKRDAIRRILTNYNLGRLQNSVWLSVYDVDDLKAQLKKAGLLSYINILEVKIENYDNNFVTKAWNLEDLNDKYKNLYQKIKHVIKKPRGGRVMVGIFRKSYKEFEKLILADPGLPKKLLPRNWYGGKVRDSIKRIQKLL